jgi:hypothetical protein
VSFHAFFRLAPNDPQRSVIVFQVEGVIVRFVKGFEGYGSSQPFTAQARLKENADPLILGN